jgi:hypothetical protein
MLLRRVGEDETTVLIEEEGWMVNDATFVTFEDKKSDKIAVESFMIAYPITLLSNHWFQFTMS